MSERRKKKPKTRPKSKKTFLTTGLTGPKGTPMNGPKVISLKTEGFPLDETNQDPMEPGLSLSDVPKNEVPKTFQTRKAEAMRKKGLNLKGNPLGSKLNSLANRVALRKEQALKNNPKNNQTKKAIKGRITDRKMEIKDKLEKAKQVREHDKMLRELGKMEAEEDPELIMEGLDPAIAQHLEIMKRKAVLSDAKAQRQLIPKTKNQTKPKSNTNLPDFRGKLIKPNYQRRIATNNVTKKK